VESAEGADYSVHADEVLRQRHGYGMRKVGADRERLQALGAFQARYIVEYAIWSANLWQVIAPGVRTTMSFCGPRRATLTSCPGSSPFSAAPQPTLP